VGSTGAEEGDLPATSSTAWAAWRRARWMAAGRASTEPGEGQLAAVELFLLVTRSGSAQGNWAVWLFPAPGPFSAHLPAPAALMCQPSTGSVEMGMQIR